MTACFASGCSVKSRELLSNMLPRNANAEALLSGKFVCEELENVTLLYSDMKGFTDFASHKHPTELALLLDEVYSAFDRHLNHFGLYKIDIIGDAFVVVGGIGGGYDVENPTLNCVKFAFHMLHDLKGINEVCIIECIICFSMARHIIIYYDF